MYVELTGVWVEGPIDDRLPQSTAKQINISQAETGIVDVQLFKSDGSPLDLDLTGNDELVLSIRRHVDGVVIVARGATKTGPGLYRFTIVADDTRNLIGFHYYDVWAVYGSSAMRVVDMAYFYVKAAVFDASVVPSVPVSAGGAAAQDTLERSFLWTWTGGTQNTVAIPGAGMADASYIVEATIAALPFPEAPTAVMHSDPSSHTTTQFVLTCAGDGSLITGTTIHIYLRDRS